MTTPPQTPIFVYGSLREGFFNYEKALRGRAEGPRPARVRGTLYHMPGQGYPALLPGDGWVCGELYHLADPAATLPVLDGIEAYTDGGADNEYDRRATTVHNLETGLPETAWVYWYARPLPADALPLPEGDWKAYMLGGAAVR